MGAPSGRRQRYALTAAGIAAVIAVALGIAASQRGEKVVTPPPDLPRDLLLELIDPDTKTYRLSPKDPSALFPSCIGVHRWDADNTRWPGAGNAVGVVPTEDYGYGMDAYTTNNAGGCNDDGWAFEGQPLEFSMKTFSRGWYRVCFAGFDPHEKRAYCSNGVQVD